MATLTISRSRGALAKRLVLVAGLLVCLIWTLVPVYWILATSLKTDLAIYREPSLLPKEVTLDHYSRILLETSFLTHIKNSFMVAIVTTVVAMICGTLAAYAISRLQFRGRQWTARAVVVTYLVPGSLLFIPMFQVIHQIGLIDSIYGLMVTYLTFTVPFATWMVTGYFRAIPMELEEAALVDGCTRLQALIRVILPISLPALAVVTLFAFTNSWNEFLYALVFIGRDSQKTLTVGLIGLVRGDTFPWGPMMAASLLGAVPPILVYVISQRWVVAGLSAGSVKG